VIPRAVSLELPPSDRTPLRPEQIRELEQEIEILKRFTAYWVKEGGN